MQEIQPSRMLAILLGAWTFPHCSNYPDSLSAFNSAIDMKKYLTDEQGLGLPRQNLLWLFDDSHPHPDQLMEIGRFLERRTLQMKSEGSEPQALLIYYVGHGLFTRGAEQAYCLAVHDTNEMNEGATSMRASELARVVKDNAFRVRQYLIFDCCFAASIVKEFQAGPLTAAVKELKKDFPEKGTALLCSSNKDEVSLTPPGLSHTMFSSALIQALRDGHKSCGSRLSFNDLGEVVRENLRNAFPDSWVRPEVHSPDQRDGDIAQIPLFPNPAYRKLNEARERPKPAPAERRAEETARDKPKATRDAAERKRTSAGEMSRLAAQEAAADRILERQKRKRAQEAEKKRLAAKRAAEERELELAKQKQVRRQTEQPRIAAEKAAQVPTFQEVSVPAAEGTPLAAIIGGVFVLLILNVVSFFAGKFWASLTSSGTILGISGSGLLALSFGLGALPGGVLGKGAKAADRSWDARYLVACLVWPGFLVGFRFINSLSPESQPSVWLAIAAIAGFLAGVFGGSTETASAG